MFGVSFILFLIIYMSPAATAGGTPSLVGEELRHNTVVESSGYCLPLSYISLGPMQFAACSGDRY